MLSEAIVNLIIADNFIASDNAKSFYLHKVAFYDWEL